MERFGHSSCNVDFLEGYIESLGKLGIKDNSFDIVVLVSNVEFCDGCVSVLVDRSNCVVNLVPDKEAVFREVYRVLKVPACVCWVRV